MKITLLATGSRGDVQPYLALAYGLSQAGHAVDFAANAVFESWVRRYSLNFRPIHWDPQETLRTQPPPIHFPHTPFDGLRHGKTPLLCALSPTVIPRPHGALHRPCATFKA